MAVNTTKSGGIYIEIGGDAKPLHQVLEGVKTYSNQIAGSIAKEFNGAMSSVDASRAMNGVTRSFAQLKAGLQGASANVAQFEKNFQDMGRQIGLAQNQAQAFGQTMSAAFKRKHESDVTAALRAIQRQAGLTNAEMEKLAKTMGAGAYFKPSNVQGSVSGFGKMAISSAAAYLSVSSLIGATQALTESMLQMSRLNISYQSIFGGSAGATQQLDHVYAQTQAIGLQFQETAGAAKTFFAASQGTALQKDINGIFDAISNSAAALQMSTDDVNGVFLALGQMVSKGKVQAEELRGQLGERLPGAFQLAAKSMGMSTAALDKFMADGKLLSEDLLPKLAQALNDKYAKAAEDAANSVQGSINRMSTEWEIFKAHVVNSDFMVGTLNLVTSALKSMNAEASALREDIAIIQRMSAAGIQKRFVVDDEGESGSLSYTSLQKDVFRAGEVILNGYKTAADGIAREQEAILARSRKTTEDFLKNTKEAKLAALEEERNAALKNSKELEAIYTAQGVSVDSVLKDRLRIETEYQRRKKEIEEKGTGGAKGLANKQFKFDTGLEQLRQEVANMEATINPAAVGIDKLRQKLALEKKDAIAAAEAHATLAVRHKEASADEAATRKGLEIRKAELIYAQKLADAEEKGRQVRVDFYKDFAALSGNYVDSINAQIEAIRRQAEEYRNAGISEELTQQWEALKRLESARDPLSGSIRGLRSYANEATDMAKGMEQAWTGGFTAMEDAAVKSIMNMKLSFTDMANSIISDLVRIAVRSSITGPLASGLGSLLNFGGGVDTSAAGVDLLRSNTVAFGVGHSGGKGGSLPSYHVSLPSSVVASAPRFHGGTGVLKPNERAAVILKDERVLSPAETRAFDAAMIMSGGIPKSLAQGTGGRSGGYSSSAQPQVFVNIQNNTGAEVSQRTRTDNMGNKSIEVMIGDAAAKQTAKPGTSMNRVVRSATGGRARTVQH